MSGEVLLCLLKAQQLEGSRRRVELAPVRSLCDARQPTAGPAGQTRGAVTPRPRHQVVAALAVHMAEMTSTHSGVE